MKIPAPAKVNLYLRVTGRRPDGYHELVSVMQALSLSDELIISAGSGGIEVTCDRPDVPGGRENIVYRAVEAVLKEAGADLSVRVHIEKRTPVAAGLGGGSSDAAAAMRGVNALFGLGIKAARLREIGLSLGADVPFFLSWPSALAGGVGEILEELPPPAETWIVLINPGFPVPTGWVYANLNLGLTNTPGSITLPPFVGRTHDAALMASYLHNDLERVTLGKYPLIGTIKERLVGEGALGALMSGSGPTVFGIFEGRAAALKAADRLAEPGWTVLAAKTIQSWPEPVITAS